MPPTRPSNPVSPPYAPLRVHGHHSLLTGVDSPQGILARAEGLGLRSLALIDVDTIAGVTDWLRAARDSRVRPIVGAELSEPDGRPGRVVALVRTAEGWRNLCKLVSARQLGGDPGEREAELEGPEVFDLVEAAIQFRAGLTYLVDHPRLLYALAGRVEPEFLFAAVSLAALQRRGRTRGRPTETAPLAEEDRLEAPKVPPPARAAALADLVGSAEALGLELVAAPDVYHVLPNGREMQRVRTAVKHNALLCDLPERWTAEAPAHLPTPAEARALYAELPGVLERSIAIAEACAFTPELGGVVFPDIELEAGDTAYSRLVELAFEGARKRYRPLRPEVVRRLDYELGAIDELGFAAYFLLVRRIAEFAWREAIPCVGRGSAADSLVSYCLELTDADPLRYNLPFERFLNPKRADRPDIDLDFCWRRRDEVLEAVYTTFGPERTAMISTLNCFGLRAAFREAGLVHGLPPVEVNRWSKRLPYSPFGGSPFGGAAYDGGEPEMAELEPSSEHEPAPADGAGAPPDLDGNVLEQALRATPECRDFPFEDERMRAVLAAAAHLLDTPRHFGLHPGGVVVSPGPITDWVACQRSAKGPIVTQLDKDGVEAIGLVKMDLLGNRALTVLDDCQGFLREQGVEVDLAGVAEDDLETARLLVEGGTLACFQVESPGMRHLLIQTGARDMDAVIQAVALIRPGPAASGMKDAYVRRFRGREEPTPPHPLLTELLADTHGVMLYQEDVMRVAALMAGMDLGEADQLRRALAKRRTGELEKMCARFREGCAEHGVTSADAARVWELVANFASFGFCKAHAVTYGRISYRAVYLKAHWPAAYMVAFLASRTGYYETRVYIEEARRLGVGILGPDVNKSALSFTLEGQRALRIGLDQVKGLSERLCETILEERSGAGPFLSLPDLLERTRPHRDEAESLIQCGALDAFDHTRPELLWRLHLLVDPERRVPRDVTRGEYGAFDRRHFEACRETPTGRQRDALEAARARTGGWGGRGLGLGNAELGPGETPSLFAAPELPALALPRLPDLDLRERALLELELLGLTTQLHPVVLFPPTEPAPRPPIPCNQLPRYAGGRVALRGWLAATRRVRTADHRWMRFLTLEDESGLAEAVMFPDIYEAEGHKLTGRGPFVVTGVVQNQMGAHTLEVERIEESGGRG